MCSATDSVPTCAPNCAGNSSIVGVELVLGEGLEEFPPTVASEFATFTVTTNTGRQITADIWFQCFGVTPVSDYLQRRPRCRRARPRAS